MTSPLISVIIPVFNTGASARSLVERLLQDSYQNLEIILVDDGSTDDSLALLRSLKSPKVKVFSQPNHGVSAARNLGIEKSHGALLCFIDSDDSVSPQFFSQMSRLMANPNIFLAVSGVRYQKLAKSSIADVYVDNFAPKPGESLKHFVLRSLLHDGRLYPVFNKAFRADLVREANLRFDESLKFAEDTKFVLDYLKLANNSSPHTIAILPKPLYIYNYGTQTSSARRLEGNWQNWKKSFQNLRRWVGKNTTLSEKALLCLIRLRWRISWLRTAQRGR